MVEFTPPILIRGPHVQSVVARVGLRRARVRAAAAPLLAASEDIVADVGRGVRLLVHCTRPRQAANGRTVIILHGWEGSAEATYVLSLALRLWEEGYRIVRVDMRDHGDSHHLNEGLFHSCLLDEMIGAVEWVQTRYERDHIVMVGSSLGGNFALRIAARAPAAGLDIGRVVAVCPVIDPEQTMLALDNGSPLYKLYFMKRWQRSLELKKAAFPELYEFGDLGRFSTLEEMTGYFVRNYTEFPDLRTYLRGYALTGDRLAGLSVPSTMLLAEDDPVIPVADIERIARPGCLRVRTTPSGGHCGFIVDYQLTSWSDQYVLDTLASDSRSLVAESM
ncbi:MAG: YheT family hydrolase [Gammaproteobacteria bacterium]